MSKSWILNNSKQIVFDINAFSTAFCRANVSAAKVLLTTLCNFCDFHEIGACLLPLWRKIIKPACDPPSGKFANDASANTTSLA